MAISGVNPKCYILALFVRDDGTRFLLGDDPFEFKDNQLHFQQNTMANDVVEVQGNDGYLLAGQVRRPGTQMFDGYVCNGTNSKEEVEVKRRAFLQFFRRSHFYKVIYIFPNGTAIQRKQGFLVDDPTVQELYQQYPEYHVALNFEDVNYYTYEEDDQGHEIYAKEAIVSLAGGGATGGLIWDNYGVVWEDAWSLPLSISGVQFQILNNAGARAPIDNVKLYGDTFQQTYSGKNLFPLGTGSYANHGFNSVYNADGSITVSGTADATYADLTASRTVNYEQGKTYTFSITEALPINIGLVTLGSGTQREDINIIAGNKSGKRTLSYTHNTAKLYIYNLTIGQSYSFTVYPMVEEGSTASPFEPYTGGPAPNPDYPQPIQVVTGEQTVMIHGKNLINSAETHNSINSSGTILNGDQYLGVTDYVPCEPNTVYAASFQHGTSDLNLYVGFKDNNGNFIIRNGYGTLRTFTTPENATSMFFYMAKTGATPSIGGYAMLEYGSTVSPFEPYQGETYTVDLGATELCKIGNYQDKIFNNDPNEDWYDPDLEDNAWYVHKACGRVICNGSETWSAANMTNNWMYYTTNAGMAVVTPNQMPNIASNYFSVTTADGQWTSVAGSKSVTLNNAVSPNTQIRFTVGDSTNKLADFKTWLSTHSTTVYYKLATPTDTKITDATLIGQLESIGAMKLFIGENNVLVSAADPNLPATLAFDYYTKFAAIGAEWEEGGTKGATIVNVDAIDNTYPVWELTGPATNPTLSVLTTNTTLTYNGTITASQKLVIDMFNKTATLNGTSVIGNISGDFVYMAPGTNRVAYTAGNTDAPDSTIYWQEVVG